MDTTALFKLTYGLFVAGVSQGEKKNACIINTASQATSDPARMVCTMLKSNLTTNLIKEKGSMSISVLSISAPLEFISSFGMRSGRDHDKFDGVSHKIDGLGNPYFDQHTIARMALEIETVLDLGTHYLFVGLLKEAEKFGNDEPMTYAAYRTLKSGGSVNPSAPAAKKERWVCSVCHYVYDGAEPFEALPESYICPVCGKPKSVFVKES